MNDKITLLTGWQEAVASQRKIIFEKIQKSA
jgi:hypothetical protein